MDNNITDRPSLSFFDFCHNSNFTNEQRNIIITRLLLDRVRWYASRYPLRRNELIYTDSPVIIHESIPKTQPKYPSNFKPYSARTGLKYIKQIMHGSAYHQLINEMSRSYKRYMHCAYYSYVFYNKTLGETKIIENDNDFEEVKKQYVRHMNRSHPDICRKKLMKSIDNKESLV